MKKKLFYDAALSYSSNRGMSKFVRKLTSKLSEISDFEIIGLVNRDEVNDAVNFKALGNHNVLLWEQLVLPKFLNRTSFDGVMIFPYNTAPLFNFSKRKVVIIVHDLIFMHSFLKLSPSKSLKQNIGRVYRKFIVPKVIRKADIIITVSNYSKSQIIDFFSIAPEKVLVIPNTVEDRYLRNISAEIQDNHQKYILNVGGEAPHKNIDRLIDAYYLLDSNLRSAYKLKILGINSEKIRTNIYKRTSKMGIDGNVELLGNLNDDEVLDLYLNADCFVFPSLYEGFGIPLIEAMNAGCPIVCSNSSCLPEIAGKAAIYFDPYSPMDIKEKISTLLKCPDIANNLRRQGLLQARKYNMSKFTEEVQKLIALL